MDATERVNRQGYKNGATMRAFQMKQSDNYDQKGNPDRKKDLRETVNLILPDGLMIALAILMIPIVLIPVFVVLPETLNTSFRFADYCILGVFIIEYLFKAILARNILKHILNPWHLLDLFIILLPLVTLLPGISYRFSTSSPILRLLRIGRIIAVGSRAVDRKIQLPAPITKQNIKETTMDIHLIDITLENIQTNIKFNDLPKYLKSPTHTWVDISGISEKDFTRLSDKLGIPQMILESDFIEESYPRVDYFESFLMIFARIAKIEDKKAEMEQFSISHNGVLVICQNQNIITLSRNKTDLFNQILKKTKKIHTTEEPLVVTVLYALLKYILEKDRLILASFEQQLMTLENIPLKQRPSNFLEITFYLRKEINQMVPSLMHMKEIFSSIISKRVPLEGFGEKQEKVFDMLNDEATYLCDTAINARDNLQSLVDLYINTTSHEMNKVMRIIAVITALGIMPAVIFGALGTNLVGNPWNIQLGQVFIGVGVLMIILTWIFYRFGWLKR
ncbi:MAG: hypothetical protein NTV30_10560 [Chloroflexi bacterium]|nr:hypothetical protein [Chloroflexota bacterium]